MFSRAPIKYRLWRCATWLNERHAPYAWVSLFSVALADLYVRLVSMGLIVDVRFF